jgi:hypothetical protein
MVLGNSFVIQKIEDLRWEKTKAKKNHYEAFIDQVPDHCEFCTAYFCELQAGEIPF